MSATRPLRSPAATAVVRWAWRLFRRDWRQQVLVLGLLTLVVAAAVAGAAVATNTAAATDLEFGDATSLARLEAADPQTAGRLDALRSRVGEVEVVGHEPAAVPGSIEQIDLVSQRPGGRFAGGLLRLRSGRYPSGEAEIALTPALAEVLRASVGGPVELGRTTRTLVGIVEDPRQLDHDFGLLDPATARPTDLVALFDLPGAGGPGEGPGIDIPVQTRGGAGPIAVLVLIAATLAMSLVGLVAVAGFLVVAHRRQRQLGLLAALGATDGHLRLVTLATGAIVGVLAAVGGAALGVAGWLLAAPAVEAAANRRIDRLDLPFALIAACMAIAVAMSSAASWWPARATTRLSVIAALSGRPPEPARAARSLVVGLVLLGVGVAAIRNARTETTDVRPWFVIGGVLTTILGVVFTTPGAIRALAAPAARLPLATRLALRDLVRFQARAAAALAAITLGLGTSVGVIAIAKASEHRTDEGNLSTHQLFVHPGPVERDERGASTVQRVTSETTSVDRRGELVAAAVPGATALPLQILAPAGGLGAGRPPVDVAVAESERSFRHVATPYLATPEVLQHYGIDPATIPADVDLLTGLDGDLRLLDFSGGGDGGRKGPPVTKVLHLEALDASFSSAPRALVTQAAAARRGWLPVPAGWLVESPDRLSTEAVAAARDVALQQGVEIERREGNDGLAALRTGAAAVGTTLALAVLAMTVGLIRSESASDVRTLTATGAAPSTRRALTATTAGALSVAGAVLAIAGAYAALLAGYHADLDRLRPLPLPHLLAIGLGLPLVATLGGWVLAGRDPSTFSRQALE